MTDLITLDHLVGATAAAVVLSDRFQPAAVVAGAFALTAHGYRCPSEVVTILIGADAGAIEQVAPEHGLRSRVKHGVAGLDLHAHHHVLWLEVFTVDHLDSDVPTLVPSAIAEAVASNRRVNIFGQNVFVVSLGHLVALKLVANSRKDLADIVELLKARLAAATWNTERVQVQAVVQEHLGWYAARVVDELALAARDELWPS